MVTKASRLDHCHEPTCRKPILPDSAFLLFSGKRYCLDCGAAELARAFHATYERLAPSFGYTTRKESAVAWEDVPKNNRDLMVKTCLEILSWEAAI